MSDIGRTDKEMIQGKPTNSMSKLPTTSFPLRASQDGQHVEEARRADRLSLRQAVWPEDLRPPSELVWIRPWERVGALLLQDSERLL